MSTTLVPGFLSNLLTALLPDTAALTEFLADRAVRGLRVVLFSGLCIAGAARGQPLQIDILYLEERVPRPPVLSNILPPPDDEGLAGALLGIEDSNTTGRFLKQEYALQSMVVDDREAALAAARSAVGGGITLLVLNTPAGTLTTIANDPAITGRAILFNTGAADSALRQRECRTGLLHTLPSRAMLADGLAQFLVARRWKDWFVLSGERPQDLAWVAAYERSAKRFGARIVSNKQWSFDTDLRRTAQQELPLFTQGEEYDVTLVADELGDVGEYVPYNTWLPRPVAGTQGLRAVAWDGVVEQWGAQQLQNRFRELAGRAMHGKDYASWVAVRSVAEAVTRVGSADAAELYAYLLGEKFEIAAFKGRSLTYRPWNGQLRQPIPLVHPRALVTQSPQAGFLHPRTELDTLGYDAPETRCDFETSL